MHTATDDSSRLPLLVARVLHRSCIIVKIIAESKEDKTDPDPGLSEEEDDW